MTTGQESPQNSRWEVGLRESLFTFAQNASQTLFHQVLVASVASFATFARNRLTRKTTETMTNKVKPIRNVVLSKFIARFSQ
jgi:hypothetical protein